MPDGVTASLSGARALLDQFEEMDKRTAVSSLKKVARKGGNVFLREARRQAPRETGQLAKSLKIQVKVLSRIGEASAMTKPRSNKNPTTGRNPVHYQHLVTRGTAPHVIPGPVSIRGTVVSNVQHPGAKANPYVDRAFDRKGNEAIEVIMRELRAELDRVKAVGRAREAFRELF